MKSGKFHGRDCFEKAGDGERDLALDRKSVGHCDGRRICSKKMVLRILWLRNGRGGGFGCINRPRQEPKHTTQSDAGPRISLTDHHMAEALVKEASSGLTSNIKQTSCFPA
jgi:hypothetical protein